MRIVITAGGTGGHIFPALAIYHQIKKEDPTIEVLYIGTEDRMESHLIPEQKIPYVGIEMHGLNRKNLLKNIQVLKTFKAAINQATSELKKFRPDVVIGTGGYITAPVIYAAHRLGIKTLIHEQNSISGVSNRFLSHYADRICVSFKESLSSFPKKKVVFTGNPRSEEVALIKKGKKTTYGLHPNKKLVNIVMGSLGSMTINEKLKEMIPSFLGKSYEVLIVTGDHYYEEFASLKLPSNVKVFPFLTDFLSILKCADLIVSRAGASSIAEITALGLPSILVPSPYVTQNHQMKNALALLKQDAALLLEEKNFQQENLLPMIDSLLEDETRWQQMHENAQKMGILDSANKIYQEIIKLVKENV